MRRMLSEEQLKKKILQYAPGGEGAVQSVNGETGEVVLTASDINALNSQSIQANLERIDLEVEGIVDDIADLSEGKLDASKSAVSDVGGLVIPNVAPAAEKLVGIDTANGQELVSIGNNLSLVGGVLSATGSGTEYTAGNGITIVSDIISVDFDSVQSKVDYDNPISAIGVEVQDVFGGVTVNAKQGFTILANRVPALPSNSADGKYKLVANKTGSTITYEWEVEA